MSCQCAERIYITFNYPLTVPGSETLLTGIRQDDNTLYITGFYKNPQAKITSFVYTGTVAGTSISNLNNWHTLTYPSSVNTSLYGPSIISDKIIRAVGNYTVIDSTQALGCLYEGLLNGKGNWITIIPPSALNTICHSTMGNLVVGNYDTMVIQGKAFIYDIKRKTYRDIVYPDSKSNTAYGIWKNSKHHYNICGGYDSKENSTGISTAYVVDYNSTTHKFSNWASYTYNNDNSIITHFEGISAAETSGYTLVADSVTKQGSIESFTHIKRKNYSKFRTNPVWEQISVPNQKTTSGNSIANTTVIGVSSNDPDVLVSGYVSIII